MRKIPLVGLFLLITLPASAADGVKAKPNSVEKVSAIWRAPSDISSRNLFYGIGGKRNVPQGTFTFVKEDKGGTTPKFIATDRDGTKWKVKMGIEARPETAASRLVWAVGYETDEDYFVQRLVVREMPVKLRRGQDLRGTDGTVRNVCLERVGARGEKVGTWKWRSNPFTGTRELNGLRVVMALINNWDLKDQNTSVFEDGGKQVYEVSDLGATFGAPHRTFDAKRGKGNLATFEDSRFIRKVTPTLVDFESPARPSLVLLVNPKEFIQRVRMEWIGNNVPRADVRWMAGWLAKLSREQIRDVFRGAGYSAEEIEAFARVVERRIAALKEL